MTPTVSAIFFTTASGAGYGLIALMAIFQASGVLPTDPKLGLVGFAIAFALITVGLVAPVLRPGRLTQAWSMAGQWHVSWQGRAIAFALLTYPPAGAYATGWYFGDWRPDYLTAIGMVATMLCMQTVYCTAMIYTSRKTIRAWSNAWVLPGYFGLSILTGALILHALTAAFGYFDAAYFWVNTLAIIFAGFVKMRYWQLIDRDLPLDPSETTTEPGAPADALDPADTADPAPTPQNYLLAGRHNIFARAYADKLRQLAIAAAFMVPILLITLANISPAASATVLTIMAAIMAIFGVLIERWLFFAEAQEDSGA